MRPRHMPGLPTLLPMLLPMLLAGLACAAGAVEQPTGTVSPVATDTLPLAFLHDPQNATHLSAADGRLSVRFRANPSVVRSAYVISGDAANAMVRQFGYRGQDVWRGTLPDTNTRYSIRVETAQGSETFGPFTVPSTLFRAVAWVGTSVGYQIFPERFQNGDPTNDSLALSTDESRYLPATQPGLRPWRGSPVTDGLCCHEYFGGDLAGIVQQLDALAARSVTLLYLNPVFSSGSAHGYDTWDYLQVEPSFGTTATLRTLVDQAHARGVRVVFDFVPNHVGVGFPGFQDAVARGTASAFWNWFSFTVPAGQIQVGNPAHYATFAGTGSMPKLNTANADVSHYLLDVARTWLEFGFDGIRVDVPNELVNAADFARQLRQTARSARNDAYLVGEIWDRAPAWVQGDQFDALMNYAVGQAILEPFVKGTMNATDAATGLSQIFMEYPEASTAMAFNVMATHDTPRLLTALGAGGLGSVVSSDQRARGYLAQAMLFALPGVPMTFQGDECGFTGAMNENRYPMQWDQCDDVTRTRWSELAMLRRSVPALHASALRLFTSDGAVLAWLRGEPGVGEVLAVFNAGLAPVSVALPAGRWTDLLSNAVSTGNVQVAALGWRYLQRQAP